MLRPIMTSVKSSINVSDDEHSEPDSTSSPISPGSSLGSLNSLACAGVTLTSDTEKEVQLKGETYTYAQVLSKKKQRRFWVYQHGIELRSGSNAAKWWYQICHRNQVDFLLNATSTNHIKAHLYKMHQITDTKGDLRHNMALTTLSEALSLPPSQDQAAHFKKRLIEWMTSEHISYHQVHAESFRAFIASCSLTAESLLPKSSNTVRGWIIDEFIRRRDWLRDQLLPSSKSLIHLSFDGWMAPNNVAYLDIVGHFMGADNSVKTVLLGIKHVKGSHTGENLA